MYFQEKLSSVYKNILPSNILHLDIPPEHFADCIDCFHCKSENNSLFEMKCCTYHPILPNYMVGAILSDNSPAITEGKKRILKKITNRIGVSPYGILPPMSHHQLYNSYAKNHRGISEIVNAKKAKKLQCPFQSEKGLCTIWKYRTELCSTYHCATTSGNIGNRFWSIAYDYLRRIEGKLTIYAMNKVGYPVTATKIKRISPPLFKLEDKEGKLMEKKYQNLWREWVGKEVNFYVNCYQYFKQLSPQKVASFLGIEETVQFQKLETQAKKMKNNIIPDFLQLDKSNPLYLELKEKQTVKLSKGKNLVLSPIQITFLKGFNGTTPTLKLIKKAHIVKKGIVQLLLPLMQEGILKRV